MKLQQDAALVLAENLNGDGITRTDPATGLDVPGVLNVENALLGDCGRNGPHKARA